MSYRFIEIGGIYHCYNRGVDKRNIFLDSEDRATFLHYLFVLNNSRPLPNLWRDGIGKREEIVYLHAFCLMKNHYHILIEEFVEGGVSKFFHKLGTAYALYFNKKYKRSGALFQGRFKLKRIIDQPHFNYILDYIHLNPVIIWDRDPGEILNYLEQYKWSSYLDYIGTSNFPSITQRDYFLKYFKGYLGYRTNIFNSILMKQKGLFNKNIKDISIDEESRA